MPAATSLQTRVDIVIKWLIALVHKETGEQLDRTVNEPLNVLNQEMEYSAWIQDLPACLNRL
jgi:hypothetical protein